MRKFFTYLVCLASISFTAISPLCAQEIIIPKVIVFDIHDVLLKTNAQLFFTGGLKNLFKDCANFKEKAHLVSQLICATFDPRVLYKIYQLRKEHNDITESYFNILKRYHYQLVFKALIHFANNIFVPMPDIENLLEKLTQHGYKLELLTNMGPRVLSDCRTKHPLFNKYFKNQNLINQEVLDTTYTLRKPQPIAYKTALLKLQKNYKDLKPSAILFIDDKEKNTQSARSLEWKTITFQSTKQLTQELFNEGILS